MDPLGPVMKNNIIKIIIFIIFPLILCHLNSCSKKQKEFPWIHYPGYRTELLFCERFDGETDKWFIEGNGDISINDESRLSISLYPESQGTMLWIKEDFSGDFLLEYEVEFLNSDGTFITFICAKGIRGEDIIREFPSREGIYEEYIKGEMGNYQISFHSYDREGNHYNRSRIRKNPGNLLLSHVDFDPCKENRKYYIDILKISNRIQFYVDGENNLIHDVRDKGGFGAKYMDGKIGFWMQGLEGSFKVLLDNFRIFKIIPR